MKIKKRRCRKRKIKRFLQAVGDAVKEIECLKDISNNSMGEKEILLLDSHILMLSDPDFQKQIKDAIGKNLSMQNGRSLKQSNF